MDKVYSSRIRAGRWEIETVFRELKYGIGLVILL